MKRKAKFALIHGAVNVVLPFLAVMIRQGVFGSPGGSGWSYLYMGFIILLLPLLSSMAGIIISILLLKRSGGKPASAENGTGSDCSARQYQRTVQLALVLSAAGLAVHVLLRLVLKL